MELMRAQTDAGAEQQRGSSLENELDVFIDKLTLHLLDSIFTQTP